MRCSIRPTASNGDIVTRARLIALILLCSPAAFAGSGTAFLRARDLRAAVESYVARVRGPAGSECAVECRDIPDSIAVPAGRLSLSVDPGATPVVRGRVSLAVEVAVDGVTVRRVLVPVLVRTYDSVLLSGRTLGARVPVGPDDVRSARLESTGWRSRPVPNTASLAGKRTKRILAEGAVLFEDLFEPVPVIAHGDRVTLRAASCGVCISTGAVALEDGLLGSVIFVKASHTHERLRARVIDAGVVSAVEE